MKRREFLRTAGGAAGATAAGGAASSASASGAPTALQEENESDPGQPETGGEPSPGGQTESGDPSQEQNPQGNESEGGSEDWGATETVAVGPDGNTVFEPDALTVEPGTRVVFEWESDFHNVAVQSQPDEASWEGHPEIVDTGATHEHVFQVEGTYEYLCEPHAPGMSGTIEVTQDAGAGGHEEVDPAHMGVPLQKHFIGAGAFMGIFSTLVFIFYLLKYGESAHTSAPGMED